MYIVKMALPKPVTKKTRSKDNVWLIGYPSETISGARLPSGRDVMRNFVYFLQSEKLSYFGKCTESS